MRVLFDTNIILDVLLEREPFAALSAELVNQVETGKIEGFLCATTLTTIDYLVGKSQSKSQARTALKTLLTLFHIAKVDQKILTQAVDSGFSDFEDGAQYFSGRGVGIDAVLTRNPRDFKQADVPVYSPQELWGILSTGKHS